MKRKTVFVDRERMYALLIGRNDQHFLQVMVGGFAMESALLPLRETEMREYRQQGKPALDALANLVALDKRRFEDRLIWE